MTAHHYIPKSKYYGTIVEIKYDGVEVSFFVWKSDDPNPSKRQLEQWGMTLEQAKVESMISDSHFESETAFNICEEICGRFNRGNGS